MSAPGQQLEDTSVRFFLPCTCVQTEPKRLHDQLIKVNPHSTLVIS